MNHQRRKYVCDLCTEQCFNYVIGLHPCKHKLCEECWTTMVMEARTRTRFCKYCHQPVTGYDLCAIDDYNIEYLGHETTEITHQSLHCRRSRDGFHQSLVHIVGTSDSEDSMSMSE